MEIVGGLTHNQAQEALAKYGFNELPQKGGRTKWHILLDQFKNPLVYLLVGAAVVAFWLDEVVDASLILAIVGVNAVLGWIQEYRADDAVKKLKKLGGGKVRVKRSGREMEIDTREVVPGDLVFLEEGSRVPADGRVVSAVELEVDEAVLTGESMPIGKAPDGDSHAGEVFSGTLVAKGYGWMEVVATGGQSKFGQLAGKLVAIKREESPLDKKLTRLTKIMVALGVGACGLVVGLLMYQGSGWLAAWSGGVAMAVAVIPEGLPAVLSVTLAVGVSRMARQKAVVRKLAAVEALGGATVVATDKTGTITKNEMEVKEMVVGETHINLGEEDPDISHRIYSQMLLGGVLASTAVLVQKQDQGSYEVIGDQTEGALLKLAQSEGLVPDLVRSRNIRVVEYPFDSKLRLMSVVVDPEPAGGERIVYVKGAPEQVWLRCRKKSKKWQANLKMLHDNMAKKGLRVLGLGYKKVTDKRKTLSRIEAEKNLVWLGMVGIADPLRPEAGKVLEEAARAGIQVTMMTGDSELTAMEIAKEAGLIKKEEEVITGSELEKINDKALVNQLNKVRIFARIAPEQKLRIVKAWQSQGEVVIMTGDGVNDALAIKQADVGVAMGKTGTDVARETADIVLLDDNLNTILSAVASGRTIVANLAQTVKYLLACNLGEVVTIVGAVALTSQSPLSPAQILWVNLVTDSLPALALAVDSGTAGIMEGRPKGPGKWLVGGADLGWLLAASGMVGVASLVGFLSGGRAGVFAILVVSQMVVALMVRGWRRPNRYLIGAIGLGLGLQLVVQTVPGLREVFKV